MQSNGQKRISLNKIIMLANRIKNPDWII
jgi:hypothetical protein